MKGATGPWRWIFRDNPVAVMMVGLCPAAAVTGRVIDALWMSLGLLFVLILTRLGQAILRILSAPSAQDTAPPGMQGMGQPPLRPQWLGLLALSSIFTASFEVILLAFAPDESAALGIYVPLLAVNCIILERFAPSETSGGGSRRIVASVQEAAGLGVGFAISLVLISLVREMLGSGTITLFPVGAFGGTIEVGTLSLAPVRALAYAGGAFLCLGYLAGAARLLRRVNRRQTETGRA